MGSQQDDGMNPEFGSATDCCASLSRLLKCTCPTPRSSKMFSSLSFSSSFFESSSNSVALLCQSHSRQQITCRYVCGTSDHDFHTPSPLVQRTSTQKVYFTVLEIHHRVHTFLQDGRRHLNISPLDSVRWDIHKHARTWSQPAP